MPKRRPRHYVTGCLGIDVHIEQERKLGLRGGVLLTGESGDEVFGIKRMHFERRSVDQ